MKIFEKCLIFDVIFCYLIMLYLGVYEMWESLGCIGCGSVRGVGVYEMLECMRCGSV